MKRIFLTNWNKLTKLGTTLESSEGSDQMRIIYHRLLVGITHRITHPFHSPSPLGQFTFDSFGFWKHKFMICANNIEMFDQIQMFALFAPRSAHLTATAKLSTSTQCCNFTFIGFKEIKQIKFEHNFKLWQWYFLNRHPPSPSILAVLNVCVNKCFLFYVGE